MTHPLDNPVLESLTGPHDRLALIQGRAARYLPDVSPFGALPGEPGARTGADQSQQPSLFLIMDEIERRIIMDMLERTGWNQTEAAERFLIPLSTLNQKIKRLGIDVRRRGRNEDSLSAFTAK